MTSEEQDKARKKLGRKFFSAREKAKFTQQQIADAAGVHVNFYARVERGLENPSFEKMQGIMRVLGIKSLDLY